MKKTSIFICGLLMLSLTASVSFAQKGTITFFNKKIEPHKATSDGAVTEYILGDPLYASAEFSQGRKAACPDCKNLNIRFTCGDVSYSSTQMRADYYDMYSSAAGPEFYCADEAGGIQLISGKGWYFEGYDVSEDGFRLFLNKINSKLKMGSTVEVKVEILASKDLKDIGTTVLATGTLKIKVTDKAKDPTNFLVRTTPMLTDADAEKAIADQFKVKVTSTASIYKVSLVSNFNYKRNAMTSVNENKNVDGTVWYKNTKNECWVAKFNYIFESEGANFSKLAKMGKAAFVAPAPCACFDK